MNQKNIHFISGGFRLKGTLHLPDIQRPPVVIGSHGLFSSGDSPKQIALAKKCNALNMGFFRFDHRGCGRSPGRFKEVTSFEARRHDLVSAIQMIQARKDTCQRIGLFGSSMGGAVCIATASDFDMGPLVTFASPVSTRSITESRAEDEIPDNSHASLNKINLQWDISDKLSRLHHILIFHGDADDLVPLSNAHEIYEKAGHPKKMIIQKKGDHRMSNPKHQGDFIREVALWFKHCFNG